MTAEGRLGHALRVLRTGVVLFRWAALAWMVGLAVTAPGGFERPALAWAGIGAAGAFTVWASVPRPIRTGNSLWIELALALALVVLSGVVVGDGETVTGRVFYATGWPVAAVVAFGVARGPVAGALAGLAMGFGLLMSRIVNGVDPAQMSGAQVQALISGAITFVLAGWATGLVSRLLERSEREFVATQEDAMRARERAARAEERERLARTIHDSVLQALSMVHKRGRELASSTPVDAAGVARLAEMAGEQEQELRALIVREPEEAPTGTASLREALESVARATAGVAVQVSATGPMWVPAQVAGEVSLAVKQALDNVVEHAGATKATVFADLDGGRMTVTIRDDGAGFEYDEERLRADGKLGVLRSMKGRVTDLGGEMFVESSARGTEIEFRVPLNG